VRSRTRLGFLIAVVLALVSPSGAARAEAAPANPVVRADVIAEVTPLGWQVVAVALQFARRLDVTHAVNARSAFAVTATLDGVTGSRTVVDVYSNNAAEVDRQGPRGRRGSYLIIELDPDDPNAGALRYDPVAGINNPLQLVGAYTVRQSADVLDHRGNVVLPASPFGITNQGVISPIVDEFTSMSFTDSAGTTLNFRLFQPEAYRSRPNSGRTYPLVVFLHGGGERGLNNITQITANQGAVAFADPERQASDPSFVLAPQVPTPGTNNWTTPAIQAALLELIGAVTTSYPINEDRLYLTGLSMGAFGSFDLLPEHPDLFAGALLIAGGGNTEQMPLITGLPMWITHSIDDPTVNYVTGSLANVNALEAAGARVTRGAWPGNLPERTAEAEARRLWRTAERNGSHILFTTYLAGTTPVNPHWSWVPTYSNDVMLDWLLSQRRSANQPSGVARQSGDLLAATR
jgi:predicted peptidase